MFDLTFDMLVPLVYLGAVQRGVFPVRQRERTAGFSGSGGCRVTEDGFEGRG